MPRRPLILALAFASLAASAHADKPHKPTPVQPAQNYPMHDDHAADRVILAAEPGDSDATRPDTRLDYLGHSMMPMRVIITNNSDRPLTLDDARFDFIAADNAKIPAASEDDLNRRFFEDKQPLGKKIPLPAPLPAITVHPKPVDKKIIEDEQDFGFQTTTVPPHTTIAGYLFYDMQGLDEPALKNATLEVRKVRWINPGSAVQGDALETFEVPLHPADETILIKPGK